MLLEGQAIQDPSQLLRETCLAQIGRQGERSIDIACQFQELRHGRAEEVAKPALLQEKSPCHLLRQSSFTIPVVVQSQFWLCV